jgi:hypothetical protein
LVELHLLAPLCTRRGNIGLMRLPVAEPSKTGQVGGQHYRFMNFGGLGMSKTNVISVRAGWGKTLTA